MTRRLAMTYDALDPGLVARFWAELLGREVVEEGARVLRLPGSPTQVDLRVVRSDVPRVDRDRIHLHLTSEADGDQQRLVDRVLALGGRHLDVGQLPEEGHIVLADPEGNELCVIEAGNAYLAGTGLLGELAGDGTRALGLFWAEAMGWPLVWEHDEETAIQAPEGGTKVAWGGPPLEPRTGRVRQRLHLDLGGDRRIEDEVERLVGMGARVLERRSDEVELADPDGNEFTVAHLP